MIFCNLERNIARLSGRNSLGSSLDCRLVHSADTARKMSRIRYGLSTLCVSQRTARSVLKGLSFEKGTREERFRSVSRKLEMQLLWSSSQFTVGTSPGFKDRSWVRSSMSGGVNSSILRRGWEVMSIICYIEMDNCWDVNGVWQYYNISRAWRLA